MTEIATLPAADADLIGPGRLVLVVGPSGAGKDTLMRLAQAACVGNADIMFPQRIVTRQASSSENNEAVSPTLFGQMLARGEFAFQWEAHGLRYGIPRSVADDVRAGRTIVVNASRTITASARRSYAKVTVVSVTAPPDILAARLAARARPSDGRLDDRIRRTVTAVAPDVVINNVRSPDDHAAELLDAIKGC